MSSNLIRPGNIVAVVMALMGGALVCELYQDNQKKKEHDDQVKMNLAPASLFIERRACPENFLLENDDVNKDGNWESVLRYINPLTQKQEEVLVEMCGYELCFRHFRVEGKDVVYLP